MSFRPRTKYRLQLKNQRCSKCGAIVRKKVRCKRCHKAQPAIRP